MEGFLNLVAGFFENPATLPVVVLVLAVVFGCIVANFCTSRF